MRKTKDIQHLLDHSTPRPWSLSGVRTTNDISVARTHRFQHIAAGNPQVNICVVYFEMKTGLGYLDAKLIEMAPDLAEEVLMWRAKYGEPNAQDS